MQYSSKGIDLKIGIITYHFARNYGAILQCYALQSYLESKGHRVEVLDYMTERQERNNSLHHKRENPVKNLAVNIALLPFETKRRSKERKFDDFERSALTLSPRLRTVDELASYVTEGGFDLLISGSDQVFNPKIDDFDRAFLLPFETTAKKAGFAASFGSATVGEVIGFREDFRAFDFLCVREESDAPIVENLCGVTPDIVDDPVFLLDRKDWGHVEAERPPSLEGGYVLGYFINKEASPRYLALTRMAAKELGLPVIVINVRFGIDSFRKSMITDADPSQFLGLFSGSSFVCTDSFHGTAFSLIYGKRFASFEPKSGSNDWRKRDLLRKTGELVRSIAVDREESKKELVEIVHAGPVEVDGAISAIRANQDAYLRKITDEGEGD